MADSRFLSSPWRYAFWCNSTIFWRSSFFVGASVLCACAAVHLGSCLHLALILMLYTYKLYGVCSALAYLAGQPRT